MNIGSLEVLLGVNTAGLSRAAVNMRRFETQVLGSNGRMQASFQALGSQMALTGSLLTQYFTVPIGILAGMGTKMFADFEFNLGKITGLVGIASKQVSSWGRELLNMAGTVGQAPKKLAESLYYITSGGIRGAESMDILKYSAAAASAGLGDMKVVADTVTSAINAYGVQNLSAKRALDIFIATIREGKGEPELFASNLGKIFPVATKLGVTLEDVGASMASLTRTGTSVSEAATQVRRLLVTLIQQPEEAAAELKRLSLSVTGVAVTFDDLIAKIQSKGLLGMLLYLKKIVGENTKSWGDLFPNIRALLPVLDMLGPNLESTKEVFEALGIEVDTFSKLMGSQSGTVSFRWKQAMGSMQSALIKFGETIKEPVIGLVQKFAGFISNLANSFRALPVEQQKTIIAFAAIAAVLGPLLIVLGNVVGAVRALGVALFGLRLGSIITQILLLAAAVYYSYKNWDLLKEVIAKIELKSAVKAMERVQRNFDTYSSKWGEYLTKLSSSNSMTTEAIKLVADLTEKEKELSLIKEQFSQIPLEDYNARESVFIKVAAKLNEVYELRKKIASTYSGENIKGMQSLLETMLGMEKKLASALVDEKIYDSAKNQTTGFLDFMKASFGDMASDVISGFKKVAEYVSGVDFGAINFGMGFGIGDEEEVQRNVDIRIKLKKLQEDITKEILSVKRFDFKVPMTFSIAFMENQAILDKVREGLQQNVLVFEKLGDAGVKTSADIALLHESLAELTKFEAISVMTPDQLALVQQYLGMLNELQAKQEKVANGLKEWRNVFRDLEAVAQNIGKYMGEEFQKVFTAITDILGGISDFVRLFKDIAELTKVIELNKAKETAAIATNTIAVATNTAAKTTGIAADAGLTAANSILSSSFAALAATTAAASAAWVPFPGTIAAVASNIAGVNASMAVGVPTAVALGATGMANGGTVPAGFPNDSFPAMLTSGETVIPLRKMSEIFGKGGRKETIKIEGVLKGQDIYWANQEVVRKKKNSN